MNWKPKHVIVAVVSTAILSTTAAFGLFVLASPYLLKTKERKSPALKASKAPGDTASTPQKPKDPIKTAAHMTPPAGASTPPVLPSKGLGLVEMVKVLKPTVVHIATAKHFASSPLYHWMPHGGRRATGLGTGFIIRSDGLILTNNHVVRGADTITVRLSDDREFRAKVVGADRDTDLALIKIRAPGVLPYAKLGDSSTLQIGERVVAIGNPFGLRHTVTAGIVSAKGRRHISPGGMRSPYWNFIQTDAAINPGNSGGPLINMKGEVIGVNSAIDSRGAGIGFAIPINMAKVIVPMLEKHGRPLRSYVGVAIEEITKATMRAFKLKSRKGALVRRVEHDSPAQKAGILPGDVIVEFDGKPVNKATDLPWLASTAGIGRKVTVGLMRGGKRYNVKATLAAKDPRDRYGSKAVKKETLGLTLTNLTSKMARLYGLPPGRGLIVTNVHPRSPAGLAGLSRGEVVLQVGGKSVSSLNGFISAVRSYRAGQDVPLLVTSPQGTRWVIVPKV